MARAHPFKNCASVEEYLGDTQPVFTEVLAVRTFQRLCGERRTKNEQGETSTLDFFYESCVVSALRDVGPALRGSVAITGVCMLLFGVWRDEFLFLPSTLWRESFAMQPGNVTVSVCLFTWLLDAGLTALAFGLLNFGRGDFRLSIYSTRAEREPSPSLWFCDLRGSAFRPLRFVYYFLIFLALFVFQGFVLHTLLAQIFVRRNHYYAILLGVLAVFAGITGLADLCSIGSPWGVGESSRRASQLLSLRGVVFAPLVVWWTLCAVVASWPPSFCEEC